MSGADTDYEQCRDAIAAALDDLEQALGALAKELSSADIEMSVQGTREKRRGVRQVCAAYRALESVGDDNNEAPDGVLGVLGVPAAVIKRANAVNEAKDRLKALCKPIENRRKRVPVTDEEGNTENEIFYWRRLILEEIGRPHVSLLTAYRHIMILPTRPKRVAYLNITARAVYRRSKEELLDRLSRSRQEEAEEDIARLNALPAREQFLVEERNSHETVRAQVLYAGVDGLKGERKMMQAKLPLMYPLGRGGTPPEVLYPGEGGPAYNAGYVRPRKTEEEAYLDTMMVYRYADPADSR